MKLTQAIKVLVDALAAYGDHDLYDSNDQRVVSLKCDRCHFRRIDGEVVGYDLYLWHSVPIPTKDEKQGKKKGK
jgi:hypothetical protein